MPPKAQRSKQHLQSIEQTPLDELKPYDRNPRVGDVSVIAESLRVNGQFKPIVVQRSTSKILAGNHTYMAAKKLGWKTISTVTIDVDDDEALRIVLADNRTSDFGGYDEDVLVSLLDSIDVPDGTGYTLDDIEAFTSILREIESLDNPAESEAISTDEAEVEWDDLDAESDGIVALQDDVVFLPVYDEANVYEMPEMLDDMIADLSGAKVDTWVGPDFSPQRDEPDKRWIYIVRTSTTGIPWERAIVGFFTRDYRFESWWEHPALHTQRVLNLGVTTILEPDFSTMAEQPLIVAMWQTYRQRWLARYFQEAGLTVVPNYGSLLGSPERKPWVMGGFPHEPVSGCIQMQTIDGNEDTFRMIAARLNYVLNEWSCPKTLLVYGGERAQRIMDRVGYDGEVIFSTPYTMHRMNLVKERRDDTNSDALPRIRAEDD